MYARTHRSCGGYFNLTRAKLTSRDVPAIFEALRQSFFLGPTFDADNIISGSATPESKYVHAEDANRDPRADAYNPREDANNRPREDADREPRAEAHNPREDANRPREDARNPREEANRPGVQTDLGPEHRHDVAPTKGES